MFTICAQRTISDITICQQCQYTYNKKHLQLLDFHDNTDDGLLRRCCTDDKIYHLCAQIDGGCNHRNMDDVEICDRCQLTQIVLAARHHNVPIDKVNPGFHYTVRSHCCTSVNIFGICKMNFGGRRLINERDIN